MYYEITVLYYWQVIAIANTTVLCCFHSFILEGNDEFQFEVNEKKKYFFPQLSLWILLPNPQISIYESLGGISSQVKNSW